MTDTTKPAEPGHVHAWTWTYDTGEDQHCDDCGATRPRPLPPRKRIAQVSVNALTSWLATRGVQVLEDAVADGRRLTAGDMLDGLIARARRDAARSGTMYVHVEVIA